MGELVQFDFNAEESKKELSPFEKTVLVSMKIFAENYGSRFTMSTDKYKFWKQMLKGIDDEFILAATYHIAGSEKWPPEIASVRKQAIYLQNGEINAPEPSEAWGNILKKIQDKEFKLTALENMALKETSQIYNLRQSTKLTSDRARFIDAYKGVLRRRDEEWLTLPEVKAIAGKQTKQLESHSNKRFDGIVEVVK